MRKYNTKFESLRNNIQCTLEVTNTILGKSKKSSNDISIQFGDSLITNEFDISNLFNAFFFQVATELQPKFPQSGNPL